MLLLASAPARAEGDGKANEVNEVGLPAAHFGDRGVTAFGGGLGLGGQQGLDQGYATALNFELDPALDVFVAHDLSLGAAATMAWRVAHGEPGWSNLAVSPRIGYAFVLGRVFAVWPRASVDFAYGVQQVTTGPALHSRVVSTSLYVPVDAFLLPHLALGVGPCVTQELLHRTDDGTGPRETSAQLVVEIAGWL
jgi:hypothetical protein